MTNPGSTTKNIIRSLIIAAIVIAAVAVIAHMVGEDTPQTPPPVVPGVHAQVYVGKTEANPLIYFGFLVTPTQARGLVCSLDSSTWKNVDVWLAQGDNINGALSLHNPGNKAQVMAQVESNTITGTFTALDGQTFAFTAQRAPDPSGIGIYSRDTLDVPTIDGATSLKMLVYDNTNLKTCGVLLQNNTVLSRAGTEIWEGNFGTYVFGDLKNKDGSSVQVMSPGQMGQLVAIGS